MNYRPGTILALKNYSVEVSLKLFVFLKKEDDRLVCMNFLRLSHEDHPEAIFERNFPFYFDEDGVRNLFSRPMEEIMLMRRIYRFSPDSFVPYADIESDLGPYLSRIYPPSRAGIIPAREKVLQECLYRPDFSPTPSISLP